MSAVFELMATLGIDTSAFENGLKKAQDFSQSAFGKGLAGAANIGVQAIKAAADATVSFAQSSVNAGMQFDSAMSQVGATMGFAVSDLQDSTSQAAQDMERLRNFAMEMGATTAFSATQSAEALNYMALAGYDVETSISMLPSVLDLAAAGGMDLARASDMVTDASSALGLSIEETGELVDKMAQTASKSNTSVSQLGDAILTVGGTAKDLTGGTTELAAALGILANNGIKGAEGGTALRNVLLALRPKSDAAAVAMEKIGFEAFDADGNLKPLIQTFSEMQSAMDGMSVKERQDIIASIFNKVDLKSVQAMMASTVADVSTLSAGLESAGISWSNYSDAAWMSGGGISELVNEIVYDMKTLGMSASEAQEYLQFEYDINAEDAAAAIDYVTTHIDESASVWEKLETNIDNAEGAASDMAGMQLENLEGDIKLWNSALEGAQIIISDGLTPILRDFVKLGTDGLQNMTTAFNEGGLDAALASFGETLEQGVGMILEKLPQIIEVARTILEALADAISANLPMIIDSAVEVVSFLLSGIVDALPILADGAVELILALVNGISEALPELIPAAIEAVLTIANALLENIPLLVDAAGKLILGLIEGLNNSLDPLGESGAEMIASLIAGIIGALPLLVPIAVELVLALVDGILGSIKLLVDIIPEVISAFKTAFTENADKFFEIGTQAMEGLGEGMASWIDSIVEKAKYIFSTIINVIKEFLGIHSPSTVMMEIGQNLILGLIEGITTTAETAVQMLVDSIVTIGQSILTGFTTLLGFVKQGIEASFDVIGLFIPDFVKKIVDAFAAKADSFLTIGGEYLKSFADGLKSSIANVLTIAKDLGLQVINAVKEALSINSPSAKMQEIGINTGEGFLIGLKSKIAGIVQAVKSMCSQMIQTVKSKVGEFKSAGVNMMAGIGKGFESSFANVKKKLKNMVNSLVSVVKSLLKIKSPSKVMEEIGEYTGEGFGVGLQSSMTDVGEYASKAVSNDVVKPFTSSFKTFVMGTPEKTKDSDDDDDLYDYKDTYSYDDSNDYKDTSDYSDKKTTVNDTLNSITGDYFLDRFEQVVGDLSPDKYTNIDKVLGDDILRDSIMIDRLVGDKMNDLTKNIQASQSKPQSIGDIIIPVYIGNESIETIVVNAMNRAAYRKGNMAHA